MGALGGIAGWPVGAAAAAVVSAAGVLETYGDQAAVFPLASVTKPLVGLATMVAVEEGALGLDDPVEPAGRAGGVGTAPGGVGTAAGGVGTAAGGVGTAAGGVTVADPPGVTVRQLLSHASGLSMDSLLRAARPGTRRIYSNAGFEVLGAHLARVTGIPVAVYLRQAVCEPLGLRATVLTGSPASGAVSTVADLAAVAAELLAPARLLHPSTVAQLGTVQFPGLTGVVPGFGRQPTNDWGLGFEIRDGKSPHWTGAGNSPGTYGHFGRAGTFLWVDPVARLGLVVLTDTTFEQWAKDAWPPLADAVLAAYAGQ